MEDTELGLIRDRRLIELYSLLENPFLKGVRGVEQDARITEFLNQNHVDEQEKIEIPGLDDVDDSSQIERAIEAGFKKWVHRPSHGTGNRMGMKRKNETDTAVENNKTKIAKKDAEKSEDGTDIAQQEVATSKSLAKVADNEITKFLDRDISELEILSIPEHYPTKTHSVSSLAELYYLTQTLPLIKLIPSSHKTLMTENFESALLEGKIAVLYSRIEELKRQNKWSLRQPIIYKDPFTYDKRKETLKNTQWNNLLKEAKWMAQDFKESSKFKKYFCFSIAQAIKDYWKYGGVVCIKRKPIKYIDDDSLHTNVLDSTDLGTTTIETTTLRISQEVEHSPKEDTQGVNDIKEVEENEVDASNKIKNESDENHIPQEDNAADIKIEHEKQGDELINTDAPSIDTNLLQIPNNDNAEDLIDNGTAIPALNIGHALSSSTYPFKMHVNIDEMKKIDQSIVKNLPKFTAFDDDKGSISRPLKPTDPKMVPVSRLLHPFEDDDEWYKIVLWESKSDVKKSDGPPEYQKGLFGFQSQRRFNYLKPPQPPLVKNIEYRSPTIWLPQDDKYLIHYVAEFCFNWELISEHLSCTSATLKRYESNIERRTPWQCFERYIQLNEKFQFSDMKGIYAYNAQQWLEQAHRAQSTTKRRISPLGVGNESIQRGHRKLRWASMFDAIRKCMKRREIAVAKSSQRNTTTGGSSNNSAGGVTNNTSEQSTSNDSSSNGISNAGTPTVKRQSDRIPTPSELSKLKFERDKSIQEAYLNQQATRSRMMAAVAQQQKQQGQGQPNPMSSQPLQRSGHVAKSLPNQKGIAPGTSPQGAIQDQQTSGSPDPTSASLQHQKQQPSDVQQPQMAGIGKPSAGANGSQYTPEQIQQFLQIQKQRRLMQQQAQNLRSGVNPSQTANTMHVQNLAMNNKIGPNSPQVVSGQPMNQHPQMKANPQDQAAKSKLHFAPAQVSAIINSIQSKNPNLSKEQVTKLAATYLANIQQQQQNRLNQQLQQQGQPQQGQIGSSNQQRVAQAQHKQPQIATLTPQERNQLQMLKAAKNAQQQQLQQQLQQQKQQQALQQNLVSESPNSMMMGTPLDQNNLSKLEYEQRKKLLIQKHQQQRMAGSNQSGQGRGNSSPVLSSPSSPGSTPKLSNSSLNNPNNLQ